VGMATPTPISPKELGKRLQARRRELGLNLRDAGALVGMSAATLSRVEGGDHLPERDNLFRLLDWLGIAGDRAPAEHREPHPPGAGTLEAIELHLRADKELSEPDAKAIAEMVRLAYERMRGSAR
jgi:transcriptional regulator with XRE-family HTH domain